jgi:hypothetical protein
MDAARHYSQIALDCVNLADMSPDRATQDSMMRLANVWVRLADQAEGQAGNASSPVTATGTSHPARSLDDKTRRRLGDSLQKMYKELLVSELPQPLSELQHRLAVVEQQNTRLKMRA